MQKRNGFTALARDAGKRERGFKGALYWWLESPNNPSKIGLDIVINLLILGSVILTFMEVVASEAFPSYLWDINDGLTYFFIVEYLLRFFVATDFTYDAQNKGFGAALMNKLRWMVKPFSIIDLISILPVIRFLRFLRILRLLRFVRLFKNIEHYFYMLKRMKENAMVYILLLVITVSIMVIASIGLYLSDNRAQTGEFSRFSDTVWYTLTWLGLMPEIVPKSAAGKFFAFLISLGNLAIISILVSLINNNMHNILDKIKKGRIKKMNMKNHIVLCGLTTSTERVIKELLKDKHTTNQIVLITQKDNPDIPNIIYIHWDYSDLDTLKRVNIKEARLCVVFAEFREKDDEKNVDMRTVFTVYNAESQNNEVHTLAEILNIKNAEIMKDKIKGNEIILKELVDSHLIATCIRHHYISPMIYELLNLEGRVIEETSLSELGFFEATTYVELKKLAIDRDITFLGYIDSHKRASLAPKNEDLIEPDYRLIYIK